ncbi:MAG: PTS sugar transporter subunit IIA [Bacillus sp. (in: firmicutes)]
MEGTILKKENILLNQPFMTKEEAIQKAGELLLQSGCVDESYIDGMFERDKVCDTYIGNGVAIPHGVNEAKKAIKKSGIVILQFKDGIDYNGNKTYFVIGIAGKGDAHIDILSKIAIAISDEERVHKAASSNDKDEVLELLLSE